MFLLSSPTPAKKSSHWQTGKSLRRLLLIGCLSSNQQQVFFSGGAYAAAVPFTGLELDLRITRDVLELSASPCWTCRPLRASSSLAIIMKASSTFWLSCAHTNKCRGFFSFCLVQFSLSLPDLHSKRSPLRSYLCGCFQRSEDASVFRQFASFLKQHLTFLFQVAFVSCFGQKKKGCKKC